MYARIINPEQLGAPKGYSNGLLAPAGSRLLFVAGQIGWNGEQKLVSERFLDQFAQALDNVLLVVATAGGWPEHVMRMTIYVTDTREYLEQIAEIGRAYRERMGKHYPTMSLVRVAGLLEPDAQVEIEATAALPPETPS